VTGTRTRTCLTLGGNAPSCAGSLAAALFGLAALRRQRRG
jgi:hypothetical protein